LLAEQIEGLDGLFGEADYSRWREHRTPWSEETANLTHHAAWRYDL
jgi:hypothetical protein